MKRGLLNLLTALSLLLFAASAVLWGRSHTVADVLTWRQERGAGRKCVSTK